MFKFMAGAFAALSTMFSGVFGGHGQAVVPHVGDNDRVGTTTGMVRGVFENAVHGTVTGISGNTITINGAVGTSTALSTYTVDATNAKVEKGAASSTVAATVANITVGDTLTVIGTVSGTTVTATRILDGVVVRGPQGGGFGGFGTTTRGTMPEGGAGILGTVTAVSGTTLTVSGHTLVNEKAALSTYTVGASQAKVNKGSTTSATVSSIAVGDKVLVQGNISGTTVTAKVIVDGVGARREGGREGFENRHDTDRDER